MVSKENTKKLGDDALYVKDLMDGIINSSDYLSESYAYEKVRKARNVIEAMMTIVEAENELG